MNTFEFTRRVFSQGNIGNCSVWFRHLYDHISATSNRHLVFGQLSIELEFFARVSARLLYLSLQHDVGVGLHHETIR